MKYAGRHTRLYGLREVALGNPPLTRSIGLAQTPGNPGQALIDALLRELTAASTAVLLDTLPLPA